MTQDEVIQAILDIRGAERDQAQDGVAGLSVCLGGRPIARVEGDGVCVRASRARLIAAGVRASAFRETRKEWTLLDPVPLAVQDVQVITLALAGSHPAPSQARKVRR